MDIQFVKSFSKGQITIPKAIRERIGLPDIFWLKLYTDQGKIIAEPIEKEKNKSDYQKKLLTIKGDWIDARELAKNRKQIEKQLASRSL